MMNSSRSHPGDTTCQSVLELIPAYALGATDPEETRFVERHLKDCPAAAAELQLYSQLHDDLLFEAPLTTASPRLAAKIAAIPRTDPAARPMLMPKQKVEKVSSPVQGRSRISLMMMGTAAAAILLVMLVNVYWIGQVNQLQDQQQTLQTTLDRQTAALQIASAQDATITRLVSTTGSSSSDGSILWSPKQSTALLQIARLPITGQDQEYQLWLITGDQQVSAGTFRVNNSGTGSLIFEAPAPIQDYAQFGITLEPVGGSPKPTTPPVLAGEI